MPRSATRDLWADVARILLELEGKTSFGSGRLIAPNLVLTAKHVVEAKDNGLEVRLLKDWDQSNQCWLGDPIKADVVWRGKEKLDLAVLRLKGEEMRHPHTRLRFGRYDSVMEMDNFWVAGFPDAARVQKDKAREYGAPAKLRKADQSRVYRLTVASANLTSSPLF